MVTYTHFKKRKQGWREQEGKKKIKSADRKDTEDKIGKCIKLLRFREKH